MRPILSDILTFRQHLNALIDSLDLYRPPFCQHCFKSVIWFHGYYYRKPDRLNTGQGKKLRTSIKRSCRRSCVKKLRTSKKVADIHQIIH